MSLQISRSEAAKELLNRSRMWYTDGMKPIVDPEDAHLLARVWTPQFSPSGGVYFRARFGRSNLYLHRVIAGAERGQLVDHINGDTIDNRRSNLRVCDRSGSNANRTRKRTSRAPYKGITQTKNGKWVAQIMWRKQYFRIGLFETPEAAADAYDARALELHGEYANINNIAGRSGIGAASTQEGP